MCRVKPVSAPRSTYSCQLRRTEKEAEAPEFATQRGKAMARVLIIDDEELVRLTIRQMLEDAGHTVAEAENGNAGIRKLADFEADLIITDLLMPNKEGLETITEIRSSHPELKIIAMSGGGRFKGRHYLDFAKKLGAHEILPKPFSSQVLQGVIGNALGYGSA